VWQTTSRVRVPVPQAVLQVDQPVCAAGVLSHEWNVSASAESDSCVSAIASGARHCQRHESLRLHGCDVGGAASTQEPVPPVWSKHFTVRVCTEVPHVVPQSPHAAASAHGWGGAKEPGALQYHW
jgi:hypothetical protein